jgi:lipopolysaccharide transport system permease protein
MITESTLLSKSPYHAAARAVLLFNPLVYIVRTYRQMLLGNSLPWGDFGVAAAYATAAFVLGGLFFRRLKRGFADVL